MILKESLQRKWTLLKTFWKGYQEFTKSGETPVESYYAMRNLYVQTNGWFNDIFQYFYGLKNPYKSVPSLEDSLLGGYTKQDIAQAVKRLKQDGYYIFPQRIADQYIEELLRYCLETPAVLHVGGNDEEPHDHIELCFDPEQRVASNYELGEKRTVNNPVIQDIIADPVVHSMARQYLNSQAIIVNTSLWWTTPYGCTEPSSALAQLYHFDMDRIKFLKFFLYITDVDTASGPHCYVRGSCQRKPRALLEDRRFQDAEIAAHYNFSDIKEIIAPRGTFFAVDTHGFHKAKLPTAGNRLAFQIECTSCLFGQNYPHVPLEVKSPRLKAAVSQGPPATWSNYEICHHKEVRAQVLV